jgi:hypothetical protein
MAQISWGKPRIFIGAKGAISSTAKFYQELSTPVDGSTNLTANDGDKKEALIEGGEAEAKKQNAATYELTMQVRMAKDRKLPFALHDSSTDAGANDYTKGEVSIILQPQDKQAPGFLVEAASVAIKETFTSEEGAVWEMTFYPVVNSGHDAVQWKTVTVPTVSGTGESAKYGFTTTNLADINRFLANPAS